MQRFNSSLVTPLLVITLAACEATVSDAPVATQSERLTATADAGVAPANADDCTKSEVHSPELQGTAHTLVLYDTDADTGNIGELYAAGYGTLASHFGTWQAAPVANYKSGDSKAYSALIYIGSSYDQQLPTAFLDDVDSSTIPVLWIDQHIWELASHVANFQQRYGFMPNDYDSTSMIPSVMYKNIKLDRDLANSGVMTYTAIGAPSTTLAQAVRSDGSTMPWAVRSGQLTYIGENPFDYVSPTDRYLALTDILFDVYGVNVPTERHRGLIRIEDVSAASDPTNLRALADYLASEQVPFSVATIPQYLDPLGADNGGVPESISLQQAPEVVAALQYMQQHGGTIIMHGYTHQYSNVQNPYSGVSADDYEFYRAHIDTMNNVVLDGPVAEDTVAWAKQRIVAGLQLFDAAQITRPTIFEWPHYAATDLDSQALRDCFATVYHETLYFSGILSGAKPNYQQSIGVYAPYVTQDAYGFEMIPENLGMYSPMASNQNPAHTSNDIVNAAQANRVVRDGFASFFFHGYFTVDELKPIIDGIKAAGFQFTAAAGL